MISGKSSLFNFLVLFITYVNCVVLIYERCDLLFETGIKYAQDKWKISQVVLCILQLAPMALAGFVDFEKTFC